MFVICLQESLSIIIGFVSKPSQMDFSNAWMWIAIGEFLLILFFIFYFFYGQRSQKSNETNRLKKESIEMDVDFNNVINSSFNAEKLFKILKIRCHPDRFPVDTKKHAIANKLYQKITENRNNLKRLNELKDEAYKTLNINL